MNFFLWISTMFSSWYAMVWHDVFLQYYQNIEIFCNSPRKFKSHCYYLRNNLHWGYGWSETLYILCTVLSCFSCVWLFGTPWTAAHQISLSMGFSRQEYWSGLPCSLPGYLPDPRIDSGSPAPQAYSLPSEPSGKPIIPYVYLLLGKLFVSFSSILKRVWDFLKSKILYWMALPMQYFLWENSGSNKLGDPPKGQNWN